MTLRREYQGGKREMLSNKEATKIVTRYVERCADQVLQGTEVSLRVYGYVSRGLPEGLAEAIVTMAVRTAVTVKLSMLAKWN